MYLGFQHKANKELNMAKVLFYLDKSKLSPRGGPYGVGYYYWKEMIKRNENCIDFISSFQSPSVGLTLGRRISKHIPKFLYKFQHDLRDALYLRKIINNPVPKYHVNLNDYDIVQFHEPIDLYLEQNQLNNYKGIVLLQSHSPLPSGMEKSLDCSPVYYKLIPNFENKLEAIDRFAFERADYLVFPCEEAEEPYLNNWPIFSSIKQTKINHFKYITTGIEGVHTTRSRDEVRNSIGIPNDQFVICYAGRHNEVKGYDSLKRIGLSFLQENRDSWIVVAGRLGPIKAPNNNHWLELGWTEDVHSYISSADVFILPNKVTYFDLVFLEALSLGKIVVASRTGGNRYFEKKNVPGVFLYGNEKEALEILGNIKSMPELERNKLAQSNIEFFNDNLTVEAMYDCYFKMIDELDSNASDSI